MFNFRLWHTEKNDIDGENYTPLAFVVDAGTEVTNASSTAPALGVRPVAQSASPAATCGVETTCYYGDITVNVADVAETPVISLQNSTGDAVAAFAPVAEGAGPSGAFASFNTPAVGVLSTDGNLDGFTVTVIDEDEGENPGETTLSVAPAHGNGAFDLVRVGTSNNYTLTIINASQIDYEEFGGPDATYTITITSVEVQLMLRLPVKAALN